ncbi:MAG: glycosyltransferase family 4 protein, partial [Roseiflexaceae bacterium]|nr:glycosyltransferase family 4 protein [Roseiflexaceae bacterium]
ASAPTSELRLLYVGRLVEAQKRASDVARALCQAACELPGVTAALYGAGGARPAVERIIGAAGVGERVQLGGELLADQVQPTMLGAHALVLLSDYEGLPIALLEAMACGLVPICTPMRSGIGELVEHELTGLLVADRGDGFVAAVRRLRDEPGLWQRLSLAARAHAVKHYGELSAAQRWAELLSSLPNTAALREVERPWRLQLPPTHPAFAREDHRGPPIASGVLRRGRVLLGELRRKRSGR